MDEERRVQLEKAWGDGYFAAALQSKVGTPARNPWCFEALRNARSWEVLPNTRVVPLRAKQEGDRDEEMIDGPSGSKARIRRYADGSTSIIEVPDISDIAR